MIKSTKATSKSQSTPKLQAEKSRYVSVDLVRLLAVCLMVIFHFCYDLRYFGYVEWGVPNGPGWWQFRYFILSLFIGTVGVSLQLAHGDGVHWRAFWKRELQLLLAALALTTMSLFMFPTAWIYFGILHFIAFASLCGLILVRSPLASGVLGLGVLLASNLGVLEPKIPFVWFGSVLPRVTEDFVPLFPWLGVMWIGIGVGGLLRKFSTSIQVFETRFQALAPVASISRHALLIYLLHQPLLFAGFYAAALLK